MTQADLSITYPLGESIHLNHPESPAVQPDRLALFPDGCRVLEDQTSGAILGYCISHPGRVGRPPALDSILGRIPEDSDCLYIHDVCLRPEARGRGFMDPLMADLRRTARHHHLFRMALTAVSGAEAIWSRLGFQSFKGDTTLRTTLSTYGGSAHHMVLDMRTSAQ